MQYAEVKVEGYLSSFIKCFWEFKNPGASVGYTILPDGYFDLIISIQQGVPVQVMLTGIWSRPEDITVEADVHMFAIRFRPLAAEYLFRREIRTLLNTSISLPTSFWELGSLDFSNTASAVATLQQRIAAMLPPASAMDNRRLALFNAIYHQRQYSISALSEQVHWSSRQINRYFQQQYGLSLKQFIGIVRCNASYRSIAHGELASPDVYFDQSHYIKEVKRVTGLSPRLLFRNHNDRFLQLLTIKRE